MPAPECSLLCIPENSSAVQRESPAALRRKVATAAPDPRPGRPRGGRPRPCDARLAPTTSSSDAAVRTNAAWRSPPLDDVRLVALDGAPDPGDGYSVPNELPIHVEVLRAHPDVQAVVHAHPPAVIAGDLAGVPLLPLIGAYNIPAARLAAEGIPVFRGGADPDRGTGGRDGGGDGDRPVCVLRGTVSRRPGTRSSRPWRGTRRRLAGSHGVPVVELGGTVRPLPDTDLALLPDLGSGSTTSCSGSTTRRLRPPGALDDGDGKGDRMNDLARSPATSSAG